MSGFISSTLAQLDTVLFRSLRSIGTIIPDCAIEERHVDRLAITGHPVQIGAEITDHSYVLPPEVTLRYGWSNSGLANTLNSGIGPFGILGFGSEDYVKEVYKELRTLQISRQPFKLVTGKRTYENMLFASLMVVTDRDNEFQLSVVAIMRHVILVPVMAATLTKATQKQPEKTTPEQNHGTQQPKLELNRGSFLSQIGGALGVTGH